MADPQGNLLVKGPHPKDHRYKVYHWFEMCDAVQAEIYEYEMAHVRVGQAAEILLPYDSDRKSLRGKVTFIAPFLDPKTRTVQVRMEFPNADLQLRPLQLIEVLRHLAGGELRPQVRALDHPGDHDRAGVAAEDARPRNDSPLCGT